MSSNSDQQSARELRQRAERHRLMARMVSDKRACQALRAVAAQEAARATKIERKA
jgi:hypothetical protein